MGPRQVRLAKGAWAYFEIQILNKPRGRNIQDQTIAPQFNTYVTWTYAGKTWTSVKLSWSFQYCSPAPPRPLLHLQKASHVGNCAPPANPTQLRRLFDHAFPVVYPPTGAPVTTTTSPVKPSTSHLSTSQRSSVTTPTWLISHWVYITGCVSLRHICTAKILRDFTAEHNRQRSLFFIVPSFA